MLRSRWLVLNDPLAWQDIGHSISRYALMGTQVVLILVFLSLADLYTRGRGVLENKHSTYLEPTNRIRSSV
jgi:hypothetical protein